MNISEKKCLKKGNSEVLNKQNNIQNNGQFNIKNVKYVVSSEHFSEENSKKSQRILTKKNFG